jgi:(p)ppGpp synthase/HD superfamily hydrolase
MERDRLDPMSDGDDLVVLAEQLATRWHAGQTDKLGEPYIGHPRRVAARLTMAEQRIVALLHDVLEDTEATREGLIAAGFPPDIIAAIDALTRRPGETEHDYLARVCRSPLAVTVKRADIADNRDPERIARLPDPALRHRLEQKYDHALTLLDRLARGTAE